MTESPRKNLWWQLAQGRNRGPVWRDLHLADEAVLVCWPSLLAVGQARRLCPHLLHVLQNHVAVAVKGLDACQQFPVVSARDEDLGVAPHGGLEDGERAGAELVLLQLCDFVLSAVPVSG